MSLIPYFEVGLWNTWIFMLPHVLTFPLLLRLGKERDVPGLSDGRF